MPSLIKKKRIVLNSVQNNSLFWKDFSPSDIKCEMIKDVDPQHIFEDQIL